MSKISFHDDSFLTDVKQMKRDTLVNDTNNKRTSKTFDNLGNYDKNKL